jgi:hypothetical protein
VGGGPTATTTRPRLDLRANAAAALAAILLGASVVAVRVAVREVPPVSLAVLRFGQGFLLLAGAMLLLAPGGLLVNWPGRRRAEGRGEPRAGGGFARPGTAGAPPRPTGELPLDPPDSSARPPEGTS